MAMLKIHNKKSPNFVEIVEGTSNVSVFVYESYQRCIAHYNLNLKHSEKLMSYKSVAAAATYAKKHSIQKGVKHTDIVFIGTGVAGAETVNQELIELAIVDSNEDILFHSLFRPSSRTPRIQSSATNHHGVNWSDLTGLPFLIQHWPQIEGIINGKRLGVFHKYFVSRSMKITHENITSIDYQQKLALADIFPEWEIVGVTDIYKTREGVDTGAFKSGFEWDKHTDKILTEANITHDDINGRRAHHSAIKTARLYNHYNPDGGTHDNAVAETSIQETRPILANAHEVRSYLQSSYECVDTENLDINPRSLALAKAILNHEKSSSIDGQLAFFSEHKTLIYEVASYISKEEYLEELADHIRDVIPDAISDFSIVMAIHNIKGGKNVLVNDVLEAYEFIGAIMMLMLAGWCHADSCDISLNEH